MRSLDDILVEYMQYVYSAAGTGGGGGGAGGMCPPTFLEIAVVTLENNAAQKNFLCHAPPPQIQFPSYGGGLLMI